MTAGVVTNNLYPVITFANGDGNYKYDPNYTYDYWYFDPAIGDWTFTTVTGGYRWFGTTYDSNAYYGQAFADRMVLLVPQVDTMTVKRGSPTLNAIAIAGGGAGGTSYYSNVAAGGGGGAGGVVLYDSTITVGDYDMYIGSGGATNFSAYHPENGSATTIVKGGVSIVNAIGGGSGGNVAQGGSTKAPGNGGSGGGAGGYNTGTSTGTAGQGYAGGYANTASNSFSGGAGGGGKSGIGQNPSGRSGGAGGAGINVFDNTSQYFAIGGGGGGGTMSSDGVYRPRVSATHGGGLGGGYSADGIANGGYSGASGSGGGGGGGTDAVSTYWGGGSGGSGSVIISFQNNQRVVRI